MPTNPKYLEEARDAAMCCVRCGAHIADPHDPDCPSHPFLLEDGDEGNEDQP